jgi:hypothetical protein
VVDATLAHGRAKFLCDQLVPRIVALNARFRQPPDLVTSPKRAATAFDALDRLFGSIALGTWRPDPAGRVWWLLGTDGRTYIDVDCWAMGYARLGTRRYARRGATWPRLRLELHAIARLLQRQSRLDIRALHDELEPTVFALAPLHRAAKRLGHARFALPTPHGLLVGSVEPDRLVARSWYGELSDGYDTLRRTLQSLVTGLPPVADDDRAVTIAAPDATRGSPQIDAFAAVLSRLPRLKAPFVDRDDPDDRLWAHAPSRGQPRVEKTLEC